MSRSLCHALLILLWCAALPLPVHAETKVLTAEGSYTMGEGETMTFAEAMALQKAKQIALEQAGTYIESYAKVQNYQLTAEEIQTIAGGVLQVEVLEKTRTLVGDGLKFFVKIKATVTTDKVGELAQRIKGKNVAEEYKKLQEDYARLSKEIETYKQLIVKTPAGPERDAALDQIREREKAFVATQRNEADFFGHVFSGEALIERALDIQAELDRLFDAFVKQGYSVKIEEPRALVVANSSDFKVVVSVTLGVSKQFPILAEEVARKLGGGIRKYREHKQIGIRVAEESDTQEYFLDKIRNSMLALIFRLADGTRTACSIPNPPTYPQQHVARVYPVEMFGGRPRYSSVSGKENFLLVDENVVTFRASVMFRPDDARGLKNVSAEIFTRQERADLFNKYQCGIEPQ